MKGTRDALVGQSGMLLKNAIDLDGGAKALVAKAERVMMMAALDDEKLARACLLRNGIRVLTA